MSRLGPGSRGELLLVRLIGYQKLIGVYEAILSKKPSIPAIP